MKLIVVLAITTLLGACTSSAGNGKTSDTPPASSAPSTAPAAAPTAASTPVQQAPATGTAAVNRRAKLRANPDDKDSKAPALIVRMGEGTAAPNERICLPVEMTGFKDLIGFQYTMRFDSAALRYESIEKLNLPGYRKDNFGVRFAERGYVSTLWTDLSLGGVTQPDNHEVYRICFTNLMPKGEQTPVRLQDGPTSFEVVRKDMQVLRFVWADGTVFSR